MDFSLVQILVLVATTQMKSLRTEVSEGSVRRLIRNGLVDPKCKGESFLD